MTDLQPTYHGGVNSFLKWQVRQEEWRDGQYPTYGKGGTVPDGYTNAESFMKLNPHDTIPAQRRVKVERLIGYGATREAAIKMAREALK